MKTINLIIFLTIISLTTYSQTYNSSYTIVTKSDVQTENISRTININNKEISISNFIDGGTKTVYFIINKVVEKNILLMAFANIITVQQKIKIQLMVIKKL
ncbi:MAG: hypothetical protein WCL51_04865 [Bacteroidota bacterium]